MHDTYDSISNTADESDEQNTNYDFENKIKFFATDICHIFSFSLIPGSKVLFDPGQ